MTRRLVLLLALILLATATPAAAAPPSKAEVDEARKHFKSGEGLFRAGSFDRAVEEYEVAYTLVPRPGLLFNIGSAYRKKAEATGSLDDKKRAIDYYQRYLDAEPAGKAIDDARGFIAALRSEVAASEAKQPPVAEPAPKPVPAPLPTVSTPVVTAAESPPVSPESPRDRGSGYRVAGLVTAGVGVALIGTGVYFGLKARSIADDVDHLKDQWDPSLNESGEAANRNMVILLAAGGAAVAGGAILYFVLGKKDVAPVGVAPAPTSGGAAVVVTGRF